MADTGGKGTLDLGLSAILEAAKSPMPAAPPPVEELRLDKPTDEPAPIIVRNEFESLADHAEWSKLLKLCEDRIAQNGADITEPRLWWITSHLRTNGLPVSFLTAPLEAATKELGPDSDGKLKSLASSTLAATAGALEKSGDGTGAVGLLERAVALGGKQERELAAVIDREISRLRELSGLTSRQLEERNGKIKKLQAARPSGVPSAAERTLGTVARKAPKKEGRKSAPVDPVTTALQFLSLHKKTAGRAALGAIVLVLLLHGVKVVYRSFTVQPGTPALEALRSNAPEMKLAELSRMENVSTFDGLYYDLKGNVENPGRASARPVSRVTEASASLSRSNREKEIINVSEPRETPEVQQALQQPDRAAGDAAADLLFGGIADSPKTATTVSTTQQQPRNQNFNGNRIFRILARTKILAQPSYQTDVLGMLNPGERVSAEGRVDSWLRIRSTSGRVGFIFAQDAEPAA